MRIAGTFIVFFVAVGAVYGQLDNEEILAEVGTSVTFPLNYTLAQDETFMSLSWRHGAEDIVSLAGTVEVYHGRFVDRALVQKDNYYLTLSDLQFDDSGLFRCLLMTTKGTQVQSFILQVLASPSVEAEALSVIDEGYDVEKVLARCSAVGASLPISLSWYYQDELIVDGANSIEMPNSDNDKLVDVTLLFEGVPNATNDQGKAITCVVNDALGRKIERQVILDVSEPTTTVATTTMQAYPQITKFPRNPIITMVLGNSRTVPCQAVGVPEPTVTWYKDGIELQSAKGDLKLEVVANEYAKSGVYKCAAVNKEGPVSKQFSLVVQGPPVISKSDVEANSTENVLLEVDQVVFQLECQSDGTPNPAISWEIEGVNTTGLEISESSIRTESGVSSIVNISATHFRGSESSLGRRVTCSAANTHGVAKKEFVVSVRKAPVTANTGLIAGIIVALLVILIVVLLIIYLVISNRRRGSATTSASPESAGMPALFPSCCGDKTVKSKELKEEDDGVTVEQVKEVNEDGTKEEKQKLTDAEEKPAKEQEKKEPDSDGDAKEDEKKEAAEQKPNKPKAKIGLPLQCCRGKQKVNEKEREEEKDDENKKNEAENGDTNQAENAQDEKQDQQEKDRDSGKGDTLEKVIEEPEEPNLKK